MEVIVSKSGKHLKWCEDAWASTQRDEHERSSFGISLYTSTNTYSTQTGRTLTPPPPPSTIITQAFAATPGGVAATPAWRRLGRQLRVLVGRRQGNKGGRRLGSSVVADSELLSGTWASALEGRRGGGESVAVFLFCRIRRRLGPGLEVRLGRGEQVQQDPLLLGNKGRSSSYGSAGRRWKHAAIGGEEVAPAHLDLALALVLLPVARAT
jgi:hypothetical protein